MQTLNNKITNDTLTASEWNEPMSEIQAIFSAAGLTPSGADLDQLGKSLAQLFSAGGYWLETGIADAYVATPVGTQQLPGSLTEGLLIKIRVGNNSTGASTLNAAGLGVKPIVREDGTALASGDLTTTHDSQLRFSTSSGGRWFLSFASLIGGSLDTTAPRGYISGMIISVSGIDQQDLVFSAGIARSSDNTITIVNNAPITKQLDATWAEGDNAGGLADGVNDNLDWYHIFALGKSGGGGSDFGFDTDVDATNLLADAAVVSAGYNRFRRVGSLRADEQVPNEWVPFIQLGDEFVVEGNGGERSRILQNAGTAFQKVGPLFSPPDLRTIWQGNVVFYIEDNGSETGFFAFVGGGDLTSMPVPSSGLFDLAVAGEGGDGTAKFPGMSSGTGYLTNLNQEISVRWSDTETDLFMLFMDKGYTDNRGKDD